MSILIKGMEMPTSCRACPLATRFFDGEDVCAMLGTYVHDRDREDDCPLVPVPPHGNLIEKNAVFELIRSFPNVDRQLPVEFMKALYELPTILEAEEGE